MGISCQEVWRDISDYIDEDLVPLQRAALDQHFVQCRECASLINSMRNVISLYRDERVLAPPSGFHERLHKRLREETSSSRRHFLAWALAASAALPLGVALFSLEKLIVHTRGQSGPAGGPDPLQVAGTVAISIDHDDKVYHLVGCPRLQGKAKLIPVEEAIRDGYTPDSYCIEKARSKKNS